MPRAWLWFMAPVLALAISAGAKAADRWDTVPDPTPLPRHLQASERSSTTARASGTRRWGGARP